MTAYLPILIEGNPILKRKCEEVSPAYPNLQEIIYQMCNTLDSTNTGVGLAAPQVGVTLRMFILGGKGRHVSGDGSRVMMPRITFINPEIIEFKGAKRKDAEGCLSVPGVYARVERHQKIKIKYFDENFEEQIKTFKGFQARVVQHEYDHMDGIKFYDRLTPEALKGIQPKLDELRMGKVPKLEYIIKRNEAIQLDI